MPSGAPIAFVLGGGGVHGAVEVGMLAALTAYDIRPDMVIGTSVGAINGSVYAADPTRAAVERLTRLWTAVSEGGVFGNSMLRQASTLMRTGTHLHGNEALRDLLTAEHGERRIEDLAVHFECVAAAIEEAAEHWFVEGPLVPAVLASSAVPGVLPPVRIGSEHYLDGGLVASIPVDRAVALGARTIYVLQVGRIEQPLVTPSKPWEVAQVAFEIARRHRFATTLATLDDTVAVHVLPSATPRERLSGLKQLRYRDFRDVAGRIAAARAAAETYLAQR